MRIIGIDLGTSTSEVSYLKDGKPYIVKNEFGKEITPSVVSLGLEDEWIVGSEAKERALLYPKNTVMEIKRLMGTDEKIKLGNKIFTPSEISAEIIKYLKESVERELNEKIERVVITVPAYFNEKQRKATVEAGKLAGLKVERIINEPTAAALAYGINYMEKEENILIYDFGGGTLDVTLLEMFDSVLEVKASSGNNKLGGKEFDQRIIDYILERFLKQNQLDLSKDIIAMIKIKEESEKCKIALSTESSYTINIPFIIKKRNVSLGIHEVVTKEIFEDLIIDLIELTKEPIDIVLNDSKMNKEDIDLILLVGGTTKVPLVRKFVEEIFGKLSKELINPDLAVAQGAAIQGGLLNDEFDDNGIMITDVSPYPLGIAIAFDMFHYDIMDILIKRNTIIPKTVEKIYETSYDNQEIVRIEVYQGEDEVASNNNLIDKFELSGIPRNSGGNEKIKVCFSYNLDGMLEVEAIILSTGKNAKIKIDVMEIETEETIDINQWKNTSRGKEFKSLFRKIDRMVKNNVHGNLEDIVSLSESLKVALIKNNDASIDQIEDEIIDLITE
jgi:molecular chaperone DnaK